MDTEIVKTVDSKNYNRYGDEVIVCQVCEENKTTALGTKKCDRCWELGMRIERDVDIAKKIIAGLETEKTNACGTTGIISDKIPTPEQCAELALNILCCTKEGFNTRSVESTYTLMIESIQNWYKEHFV